ncbi:MAG: hypothetical protein ACLP0L_14895 [Solirubrobacteraceae bacterium]
METARDLACADLWQASLERSLARRGKATRSSLELFHLQPERDLSCGDLLRESAMYSQLRRSAAARRPAMTLPGAGGISALALLAAATLPGLLGGRGTSARTARITYKADEHGAGSPKTKVAEAPGAVPAIAARPATTTLAAAGATTVPTYAADPHPALPAVHASRPAPAHRAHATIATAHVAGSTAHIAAAGDATGGAGTGASSVSGGAAPAAEHSVAAANTQTVPIVHSTPAVHRTSTVQRTSSTVHRVSPTVHRVSTRVPRVPAAAKTTHAHTGGSTIEDTTSVGHPRPTTTAAHPKPVAKPRPVATTPPPTAKPAPAPVVAPGQYVNPLAGASVTPERIDQGVDYAGSGPLGAIGDGTVTYVGTSGTGWPGAYVEYRLTDGPDAGRYVYYAEGISPAAGLHVGQSVHAGQTIAEIIAGDSNGIEIGWGAGVGTESYAMQQGQWQGGDDADSIPSPAGKDFSALIAELGGPPGKIEG